MIPKTLDWSSRFFLFDFEMILKQLERVIEV
jgi:hypothetical protein